MGFNIYRSYDNNLSNGIKINGGIIPGTNGSEYFEYSYTDQSIDTDGTYYYWLENYDYSTETDIYGPITVKILTQVNEEEEELEGIVVANGISSIYPNPFNPSTTIRYYLENNSNVQFTVYNLLGQKIYSRSEGSKGGDSYHTAAWNGTTMNSQKASSGVYFFKIETADFTETTKGVLSK